jgi:hypothetical protein
VVVVVVVAGGEKVLGGGTKAAAMYGDEWTSLLPAVHTTHVRTSTRPTATTAATDADAARMTEFIVVAFFMPRPWEISLL